MISNFRYLRTPYELIYPCSPGYNQVMVFGENGERFHSGLTWKQAIELVQNNPGRLCFDWLENESVFYDGENFYSFDHEYLLAQARNLPVFN